MRADLPGSCASPRPLGATLMAPLRVRLREGKFREPDIIFLLAENSQRAGEECWAGADLLMEVVSGGKKSRDRGLAEKTGRLCRRRA